MKYLEKIKKVLKWGFIGSVILFVGAYSILAGYLWWSETHIAITGNTDSKSKNSQDLHQFVLMDSGLHSLKRRIAAIESAKSTIELEYFIYELDLAAQIITTKLIEAAERGVVVKVLVDYSAPVFKLAPKYAKVLQQAGIAVKYYNTAALTNIVSVQHRNHRKFLIIDSNKLITGGRNIGNDYFDLSDKYNFLDSDVEITGSIAKEAQKSFLTYWNSNLAVTPAGAVEVMDTSFVKTKEITKVLEFLKTVAFNNTSYECTDVDFATDSFGVSVSNRRVYWYLNEKLKLAKKSLVVESPYFVLRHGGLKMLKNLSKRNIKQTFLTNSLYSTDAFYTVSALIPSLDDLKDKNIDVYLYNGSDLNPNQKRPFTSTERWGLHAKRAVIDDKHILIGTYNIDPRSANFNSEVLIACNNNPELAKAMLKSMEERRKNSWPLFTDESNAFTNILKNASFSEKVKFVLALPLAKLFDFLL